MARGRVTRGGIDGDLTRETLDRMAVGVGGRFEIGCPDHPDGATRAAYQDGVVRVICRACGFEAMRVKVAPEQRGGVAPELEPEPVTCGLCGVAKSDPQESCPSCGKLDRLPEGI